MNKPSVSLPEWLYRLIVGEDEPTEPREMSLLVPAFDNDADATYEPSELKFL